MRRSTLPRARRRRQGAAFAEALIVLPILTLIYVGVVHFHRMQASTLSARGQARACAWRYANAGCRGGPPPGCENATPTYKDIDHPNEAERTMWESAMAVDALRWAFEGLLGQSVTVHAARNVSRPPLLGSAEITVGARLYLLCNEHHRSAEEIAQNTGCALMPAGSYLHDALGCEGGARWD